MKTVPFAIAIVAAGSGYGKTTLIEGVVSSLAARGMKVFVIKHTRDEPALPDDEGKDTWRFREAGACASAILSSSGHMVLTAAGVGLEALLEAAGSLGADLVICEGFKASPLKKIAIAEGELGPASSLENLVAVVSRMPATPGADVAVLPFEGSKVADFILSLKGVSP